jgi:hypothetical protein
MIGSSSDDSALESVVLIPACITIDNKKLYNLNKIFHDTTGTTNTLAEMKDWDEYLL